MKYITLILMILFLSGCSNKVATCINQGPESELDVEIGYFYDSSTYSSRGENSFQRIPLEMPYNPCNPPTGVPE